MPGTSPVRCMHLDRSGQQCPDRAIEGKSLCAFHEWILEGEGSERTSRFPMLYRLAALSLLLIFLLNAYQTILEWLGY